MKKPKTGKLLVIKDILGSVHFGMYFDDGNFITPKNGTYFKVNAKDWRYATEKELKIWKMQQSNVSPYKEIIESGIPFAIEGEH